MTATSNTHSTVSRGDAVAARVAAKRVARAEGMRRLAARVAGRPLGAVRLAVLPDFCPALVGE